MHKWFIESETLANMLYDMYDRHETTELDKPQATVVNLVPAWSSSSSPPPPPPSSPQSNSIANNYRQKIYPAFLYWIKTFPFHFVVDTTLIEAIKRFSNLVLMANNGNEDKLKLFDISNM